MDNNSEIKDTKHLQVQSLSEFMKQFGYYMTCDCNFRSNYYFRKPTDKQYISFKSAVMLHNKGNIDNHGREYERFGFSLYDWNKAKAAKIVHHVNLTANKKKKSIHYHKHLIKFVKPYYEEMFLK